MIPSLTFSLSLPLVSHPPYSLALVYFVLEYIQIVGGGHGYDVLFRMPSRVQDLLIEVQAVHTDLVLLPLAPGAHSAWFEHGPWFAVLTRRLQCDVTPRVPVEHSEEVIVRARHDGTVG